jgi:hypothetical protein
MRPANRSPFAEVSSLSARSRHGEGVHQQIGLANVAPGDVLVTNTP